MRARVQEFLKVLNRAKPEITGGDKKTARYNMSDLLFSEKDITLNILSRPFDSGKTFRRS
jgi:hypothetical protein